MPDLDDVLDALAEADEVRPIDLALARVLASHDDAPEVALAAVLVSQAQREGHTALSLSDRAEAEIAGTHSHAPDATTWREALARSPVVATPEGMARGDVRPLVLDGDRLALARHWRAEQRLARSLVARLGAVEPEAGTEAVDLAPTFQALFPEAARGDRQALAAAGALRHRLAVVAGGPGTGKTTTVVRMLALLLTAQPDLQIRLATPTGKAADRLAESIAEKVPALPVPEVIRERIPTEAATLHRLLGYSPTRRRFRHGPRHPLAADVVVVDETSMADLSLLGALVDALRPEARLILLGDPDQLPSVGAGAVLGDLCAVASREAIGPSFADACEALGLRGLERAPDDDPLSDAVVRLTVSHRFSGDSGIGTLARAIRDGDAASVREALHASPEVVHLDPPDRTEAVWAHAEPHARALSESTTREEALRAAAAFRLLAPTRGGRWGVRALNDLVERRLVEHGWRRSLRERWYHGRPVLVTTNDYDLGLFNGDVGVVWARGGPPVVVFESRGDEAPREVPVAQLPEHETAWAMTVHKSQGSEFDDVALVLPEAGSVQARRLSRQLVYTAVTRAKGRRDGRAALTLFGDASLVAEAPEERRASGLADALRVCRSASVVG
ncbi:MAG: exodeoxyribonuclease V subunit alpha [Bacteroidota bacterium]